MYDAINAPNKHQSDVYRLPIKIKIYKKFEPNMSKVPITQATGTLDTPTQN